MILLCTDGWWTRTENVLRMWVRYTLVQHVKSLIHQRVTITLYAHARVQSKRRIRFFDMNHCRTFMSHCELIFNHRVYFFFQKRNHHEHKATRFTLTPCRAGVVGRQVDKGESSGLQNIDQRCFGTFVIHWSLLLYQNAWAEASSSEDWVTCRIRNFHSISAR